MLPGPVWGGSFNVHSPVVTKLVIINGGQVMREYFTTVAHSMNSSTLNLLRS